MPSRLYIPYWQHGCVKAEYSLPRLTKDKAVNGVKSELEFRLSISVRNLLDLSVVL
jgi:hypothetical protein